MRTQRGNILFLILLAVVLFAALTYAVIQSTNGGAKSAATETVQAQASGILQYMDQLSTATMRMMLTGGIAKENISFQTVYKKYDGSTNTGWANSSCSAASCRMFLPSGGGAAAQLLDAYAVETPTGILAASFAPGQTMFVMMQFPYAGTSLNDLAMQIVYIKPAICDEIAAKLSLPTNTTTSGNVGVASDPAQWDSGGNYTITSAQEPYMGQNTAVIYGGTGAGRYCHVYRVLIPR